MPLPVNVDTCTVSGAFVNADGSTPAGTIEFTPTPLHVADATAAPPTTIVQAPITARLVAGAFTVTLAATDDTDLNPNGWTYCVRVRIADRAAYSFPMAAPAGTLDLADVTPVSETNGDAIIVGPVGPVGPQGPPGQWVSLTQAEFDALPVKDPDTLYVIVP